MGVLWFGGIFKAPLSAHTGTIDPTGRLASQEEQSPLLERFDAVVQEATAIKI